MTALTRYSGWGMPRGLGGTPQWQLAVMTAGAEGATVPTDIFANPAASGTARFVRAAATVTAAVPPFAIANVIDEIFINQFL